MNIAKIFQTQERVYTIVEDFNMKDGSNINIYFGEVVDVLDEDKINRCRIKINGHTDKIATEELAWYFPWYGLNYLPMSSDIVPVIVFDNNFSTAFYGRKINLVDGGLEEGDYETYLELYKRTVDDNEVQMTYKLSTGIELINGNSKTQHEVDKYSIFVESNSIVMTKDRIDIGNQNQEATILGDKGVKQLHDMIKHSANIITETYKILAQIGSAAAGSPFTAPIAAAVTPAVPPAQAKLNKENAQVDSSADKIQSEKTFIE